MIEYWPAELKEAVQRLSYKLKDNQRLFVLNKMGEDPKRKRRKDEPEVTTYFIKMTKEEDQAPVMECDCPNKRRGAHINDKHGQMIARWLLAGQKHGYFDQEGAFHALEGNAGPASGAHEQGEGGKELH